jgi:predicted metalloprotease
MSGPLQEDLKMRWKGGRRSRNIEDRRGMRMGRGAAVGGVGGLGFLIIVVLYMLLGGDPAQLVEQMPAGAGPSASTSTGPPPPGQEELADFVSVVLADTEDTWNPIFASIGRQYEEPKLVLFSGQVRSACGMAGAAMGPFYCPGDHKLYIDLTFYDELKRRFRAPGDFAQAYVIAHEVGHHVQNLLGINAEVQARQRQVSRAEANELSVRLELQADCLAGVWGYHTQRERNMLEAGDLEEALNAASAIGDDRIQRESTGRVAPDSFTHGSSAQRVRWFKVGYQAGDVAQCDTFRVANP